MKMKTITKLIPAALLALCWSLGAAGAASAQPRDEKRIQVGAPRPTTVFKSKGVTSPTPQIKPPGPPPDLTSDDKKTLIKGAALAAPKGLLNAEPGSVYVKLTPKDPSAPQRAALVFVGAGMVDGGELNYATWTIPTPGAIGALVEGSTAGHLLLWIRSPQPGRRFLVDCAVTGFSQGQSIFGPIEFKVEGPGGFKQKVATAGPTGQHLAFLFDAADSQWNAFKISGGVGWVFHSCEVTNL